VSICLPEIVKDAIARSIDCPIAHYSHPVDESQRTALCGVEILGVEASEPYVLCSTCEYVAARANWSVLPERYGGPPPGQSLSLSPKW
jgi:hypothetical protein